VSYGSNPQNAKAAKPTKTQATGEWVKPTYLDISLDDTQRAALKVFIDEMERIDLLAWIGEKCATGHVVEAKGEEEHFYVRATGIPGSEHAGLCLTARASTLENALYALAFRDIVVLGTKWPTKGTRVLDA